MAEAVKFLPAFLALAAALSLRAVAGTPLTVSAAASLRDVLTEIKTLYARDHAEVAVTLNFGGSGALQRQIENGAPVDVFVSASTKEILALGEKNLLLRDSIRNVVSNALVLIVPKENTTIHFFADLAKPEVRHIAIGEPRSVPAGACAAATFAFLKLTDALAPKLVNLLDVRQVLTTVETGDADAGVVYVTDARSSAKVRIAATADPKMHPLILYPCAIPAASLHITAARDFTAFLVSPATQAVFEKHGFLPAP